jgi:glutaredoxin
MSTNHVEGKKSGDIMIYALSTCVWCGKTKKLLNDMGVEYKFTDVDLLEGEDRDKVVEIVKKYNPNMSFPVIIIDGKCIIGFKENEIKEALKS